ncbi:MAG: EAL domain-containing protein, partial [Usitatibacter sp.]
MDALLHPSPVAAAAPRSRWAWASEPQVLFPAIAVLALTLVWATTLAFIRIEHAGAERAAAASSRALAETYEAQVVRALNEIDRTLKFVQYAHGLRGAQAVLELKQKSLLPPDRLFIVAITDGKGDVVATTRATRMVAAVDPETLRARHLGNALHIDRPRIDPTSGKWKLQFSRGLFSPLDGSFAGTVTLSVEPDYFVSGYEASRLGAHGLLAVLAIDGNLLATRSGESVSYGDELDYAAVVSPKGVASSPSIEAVNAWDGVPRYTTARALFDFPVAVIVGLSIEEQLAPARAAMRLDLWRAAAGSLVLILVLGILGRMSWQLAGVRRRTIEEHVAHSVRVEHLAYHDSLTSLPNRSLFSNLLAQSIKLAQRHERRLAILFIDLDRFKHINDTLGHEAGDQLLREVAARLKSCLRESDTVARLGGDEFVALLPELGQENYAADVARKILSAIARPFILRGQEYAVTASIGISVFPDDGRDEQTLKKNADIAMYRAKEEGRNNFKFYSDKLNAYSLARLSLESGLRHALEREEFELCYQPKREIATGRITGVEALLRWRHPDLGTVAPMQFIPVAEESGLIVAIGKWVLRTACAQIVAWRAMGLDPMGVAVNLTQRQFENESLLADLTAILTETGMDPRLLELEISEGLLMRDVEKAMEILSRLKQMGIRIAVDDFGAGYSSLARLRQFPLDSIKIDRALIRDVESVAENKDLAMAIIAMGRAL